MPCFSSGLDSLVGLGFSGRGRTGLEGRGRGEGLGGRGREGLAGRRLGGRGRTGVDGTLTACLGTKGLGPRGLGGGRAGRELLLSWEGGGLGLDRLRLTGVSVLGTFAFFFSGGGLEPLGWGDFKAGFFKVGWVFLKAGWVFMKAGLVFSKAGWVFLKAGWVFFKSDWVFMKAGWVFLKAGWVFLKVDWVFLKGGWGFLKADWVFFREFWSFLTPGMLWAGDLEPTSSIIKIFCFVLRPPHRET
mmetsp:Transcript_15052/g.23839  ORF Transcript_15052/g.23839 Transcript_15052/m.23839 type:complete len:244 (+) Transcript_15052:1781-2512(+)